MDLNHTTEAGQQPGIEMTPAPETMSRAELIEVLQTLEKQSSQQHWEQQRRLTQLESRLQLLEASRDREFSAEAARRLRATQVDTGPECFSAEAQESLSSRLRRAREL